MKRPSHTVVLLATALLFLLPRIAVSQAFDGYTLFSPTGSRSTLIINMNKQTVHSWTHTRSGGYSCYLLQDGSLIRSTNVSNPQINGGGGTGRVERVSWEGALLWEFSYSSSTYMLHHDICPMPNGNVLMIAWEVKTAAQALAAGRSRNAVIWPDHIIEVQPTGASGGNIVWKWHLWDHLVQDANASKANYGVVADHPELVDANLVSNASGDWSHVNSISYNPELDQIVISSHNFNEIYVIDHSTTVAEAASHTGGRWGKGGDILYRWGMPTNYDAPGAQVFDVVHAAAWIPAGLPGAGHIFAYNNGMRARKSTVVELAPPTDAQGNYIRDGGMAFGPATPFWSYTASDFYSQHLGSNQRLPNGNTFMVESTTGNMVEVNAAGSIVWSYARGGEIIRAIRYAPDYPGLQHLTAVDGAGALPAELRIETISPNPTTSHARITFGLPSNAGVTLSIHDMLGREVAIAAQGQYDAGTHAVSLDAAALVPGTYVCRVSAGRNTATRIFLRR